MTAKADARNEICGGAGRPSGGGPYIRAAPKTTGRICLSGALPSISKKALGKATSKDGPKAKAGLLPVAKGSWARVGGPAINLPPLGLECSRRAWARDLSCASGRGLARAARGATQGKDHAPGSPAANREPLQTRMGRRTSRWGTRTRSLGNECREKRPLSVFITAILY